MFARSGVGLFTPLALRRVGCLSFALRLFRWLRLLCDWTVCSRLLCDWCVGSHPICYWTVFSRLARLEEARGGQCLNRAMLLEKEGAKDGWRDAAAKKRAADEYTEAAEAC